MPTYCNKVANFFFFFFGKGGKYALKLNQSVTKGPLNIKGAKPNHHRWRMGKQKKRDITSTTNTDQGIRALIRFLVGGKFFYNYILGEF